MPQTESEPSSQGGGDTIETVTDAERGCGFLKEGKAYLRSEVDPNGTLPPFVRFEEPITFLEGHARGYSYFPGLQFELTRAPRPEDYERAVDANDYPGVVSALAVSLDVTAVRDHRDALGTLRDVDPEAESDYRPRATDPPLEVHRHIERLKTDMDRPSGGHGAHLGEMRVARSHDLLMHVGETYYPEPEDFISECNAQGLSKAIPTSENQDPPVINPGRTRVFLVHPNAIEAGMNDDGEPKYIPGVIGYAYVTRVIYTGIETGGGEVDFPEWAQEFAENGYFDLVKVGEKVPKATQKNGSTLEDFTDEDEPKIEPAGEDPPGELGSVEPESVQPSDKPGRDVEARPEDHNMPALEDDGEPDVEFDGEAADGDADDEELRAALMDLPFQLLREKANERGLNPGQHPLKEQVVDALIEDGAASLVGGDDDE